jgi:hypothetical protein
MVAVPTPRVALRLTSPSLEGREQENRDREDNGGLFVLHDRWLYTDWGTVRSRRQNRSGERESHVEYRAQDVKSHCVQSGMDRFVGLSRNVRLPVAAIRIDSQRRTRTDRIGPAIQSRTANPK